MNDVATIGHNVEARTLPTGQALTDYLNLTYGEILERAAELILKAPSYLTIETDEQDAAATEFLVAVRACWKAAENARTAEKSAYDDAAGVVHAHFKVPVLDPLGLAPNSKLPFDPLKRTDLGFGPRITMAQTLFKMAKENAERRRREDEAARLRAIEDAARRQREADERAAREAEDRRRRDAEEAERKAREEARQAELAASRKRNEETRAAAEKEAQERRRLADEATARRLEEERIASEERERREREAREAENKAAEERAAAEAAASASAADLTRIRGERGGVSSLKTFVSVRDICRDKLDLEILRPYFKEKALEEAVNGYITANKATVNAHLKAGTQPIKGCVVYEGHKSAGRA
jgi:flagellar biosynthesis GTPase FlhF